MGTPITIFMLITLIPNPFEFLKLCLYTPIILTFSRIFRGIGFNCRGTCKHSYLLKEQENAYRCIVLPKIMLDLLENRKAYLISVGYDAEYVEKLP
jgi:hypothetical protein